MSSGAPVTTSPLLAWGIKTTSRGPQDRIIEITFRQVFPRNSTTTEINSLINPPVSTEDPRTHETADEIAKGKSHFGEVWRKLKDFVEDCVSEEDGASEDCASESARRKPILVSRDGNSDKKILQGELELLGLKLPDWHFACSLNDVWKIVWPSRKAFDLSDIIKIAGVKSKGEHRSYESVKGLGMLMEEADKRLSKALCLPKDASSALRLGKVEGELITENLKRRLEAVESSDEVQNLELAAPKQEKYWLPFKDTYHTLTTCGGLTTLKNTLHKSERTPSERKLCSFCENMMKKLSSADSLAPSPNGKSVNSQGHASQGKYSLDERAQAESQFITTPSASEPRVSSLTNAAQAGFSSAHGQTTVQNTSSQGDSEILVERNMLVNKLKRKLEEYEKFEKKVRRSFESLQKAVH